MTKYFLICFAAFGVLFHSCQTQDDTTKRKYNEKYVGEYTRKIAFPINGLGAGMFCIEGTGALSNMSVRHRRNVFNKPDYVCCHPC